MHRAASSVLACLTALLLVLAAASSWTSQTALNTDRFVADVGPVIDQQPVRDAIADEVSTQVVALFHVPAAKTLIQREVRVVVGRPSFRPIWLSALRLTHGQIVVALTGPVASDPSLRASGGEVQLDLIAVVVQVLQELPPIAVRLLGGSGALHVPAGTSAASVRALVAHFLGRTVPADFATVPLMPTKDLEAARTYVGWLDGAAPRLLVLALVLLAVALVVSRRRFRTLAELGLWFAVFTVLAYFVARGVGTAITAGLSLGAARPVAVAVVAAVFDSLRSPATVLAVIGAAVAVLGLVLSLVAGAARRAAPG